MSSYNCEIYRNEVNNVMSLVDPTHADPKDLNRDHSVRVYDNFFNISDVNGYPLEITNNRVEVFNNVVDGNSSSLFIANWETAEKQLYDWHIHHNFFYDFAEGYPKAILMLRQGINDLRFEHNTVEVSDESMALFWFQGGKAENIYVRNNLVYRINEEKSWGQPISDCLAELNIDYDWYTELSDIHVENNIFHNFTGEKILKGGFSVGDGRPSGYDPYSPKNFKRANNLDVNPQVTQSGAKPKPYFTLSENSPAIDAGFKIQGQAYSGNAPDIGAIEFEGNAAPQNTPPTFTVSGDLEAEQDYTDTLSVIVSPDPVPVQEQDQTVTYTLTPPTITFANVFFNPNTGDVRFTSQEGAFGSQVFTITADDGQEVNNTASREFRLTISEEEKKDTLETGSLPIRVNSGGDDFLTPDAKLFYEDQPKWVFGSSSNFEDAREISGSTSDALYYSERVGENFSYRFPVPDGVYEVKLHFAEIFFFESGQRIFDVSIENGLALLKNFDILAETSRDRALVKTFSNIIVQDDTLSIDFSAQLDNAKISAIQVLLISEEIPENTPPVFSLSTDELVLENDETQPQVVEVIPAPVPTLEEGQVVRYSLSPASVNFANIDFNKSTGQFALTPIQNLTGKQIFTITADDGQTENNTYQKTLSVKISSAVVVEPLPPVSIPFRMNAGGTSYVLEDDTYYMEDTYFNEGTWTFGVNRPINGTDIDYIYQTERAGPEISYEIPVENGVYKVVLRFAEIFFREEGLRIMEAGVENKGLILENFDLYSQLGIDNAFEIIVREVSVSDGFLSVYLKGIQDNAQISGIEIYRNDDDSVFPEVVSLPFRMNAGGLELNTGRGLFQADRYHGGENSTAFVNGQVEDELPALLYQTFREGDNISYRIPVGKGTFDVRLYWLEWTYDFPGERIFRVKVENKSTQPENLDVLAYQKKQAAYSQDILGVVNLDDWLELSLTGLRNQAMLAGIEILEAGSLNPSTFTAPIFRLNRTSITLPANSSQIQQVKVIPKESLPTTYKLIPEISLLTNILIEEKTGDISFIPLAGQIGEEQFIVEASHEGTVYRQLFKIALEAISPPDPSDSVAYAIRINAGGEDYTHSSGSTFSPDAFHDAASSAFINSATISGTADMQLYQSERIGKEISYQIPVEDGEYDMYLHFVETFWTEADRRIINADVEGQVLFEGYDIFAEAGKNKAVIRSFKGILVEDGVFNFRLYASKNVATISAIELVKNNGNGGLQLQNLQQSVRINVGGENDKAFGGYIFSRDAFYGPSTAYYSLQQQDITDTNYDELYKSGRQGNPEEALSYDIPVVNGQYELYLHFAEPNPFNTQAGQREMLVSLEGEIIDPAIDIAKEKGTSTAMVKQYAISVTDDELNLALLPLSGRPILSAIELLSPNDYEKALILQPAYANQGLSQEFNHSSLTVFPNPASDQVKVLLEGEWEGDLTLSLRNQLGQEVHRRTYTKEAWIFKEGISLNGLAEGLYWVQLSGGKETQSKMIWKKAE
ncbi:MAG: malectin domain-containing carbohydrate-binding protein [Bacteroidota bacterium]